MIAARNPLAQEGNEVMIEGSFLRLAQVSIDRPRRVIGVLSLLVLAAALGLFRLELDTDGHALVPPADPVVGFDREVREHFGLRDPIIVYLETADGDGVYNAGTLRRVREMTEALAALPQVGPDNVMSLATERRDRVYPGTLNFRPFLDPLPETPEQLAEVRGDVEAARILTGTLVSADGRAATILVGVPPGGDRSGLYRRILATVEPLAGDGERLLVVGAPVAESLLGRHLLADLALLVPLALAVIALVLWLGCRRLWGVALGVAEVGACLAFTFGLMGWLGVPVYLTTAVLPVILTTLGLADEIHIFWHYQRLLARGEDHAPPHAVLESLREMTAPVVFTSLTTALGFLSFLTSPIAPVRIFGVFAAAGILFCLLWSLTVVPAALALIAPHKMRRPGAGAAWSGRLLAGPARRPRLVLATAGLATVGLAWGIGRLYVQDSWIDGFAPESAFYQATARVNEQLLGTHVLLAQVRLEPSREVDAEALAGNRGPVGPLLDPERLRVLADFEDFLRERPEVGGVLGPYSHLSTVHYLWMARREGARELPDDPYRLRLTLERFDAARGQKRRREVIDDDLRRAVVTIFLKHANYRDTATLMGAVRDYERQRLQAHGIHVGFAGDVAVSQAMIPAIVRTQVSSLLLALAGALVAVMLLYRSVRAGLCAVAPTALAILWTFGAMGWLGVPLGVATSMFCAITLGVGVDYGIHFFERFRRARDAGDPEPVDRALGEAGPAIVADCLAIALGFGLLGFSRVPANARLGMLVATALAASCLLTLTGLAALLRVGASGPGR